MRIIALGLGGAGCRIVNSLYAIDRRSSKVACVQALAIDVDEETIRQVTALPENGRMCFSADTGIADLTGTETPTAPIDINEIVSRVQNLESGENDAIFFCCGLGGSMVDVAPHIIAGLRSSVVEPIFGLVTLPCLAEGERISGKAADDIEMLSSLLDGIIVFDNETWHKKIKTQRANLPTKKMGFAEKIGLIKSEKPLPPAQATYRNLNEAIVRRIGLILRAGEFRADGGIDLAEVVLDSGEVLNTMRGMGFITIGYAVEKLPHDPLRFLSWLKPAGLSDEEQKKRASRIVELTKQAIYHEISTPCDLTSAHKALVLIAGPSHELSMKGFMTVRKWIDRSIAGLETRSGDYPVMNTKNVAIIVMLSGLENIPRISEIKEIRSQSKSGKHAGPAETPDEGMERVHPIIRDDMISLPARMSRSDDTDRRTPAHEVLQPEYESEAPEKMPEQILQNEVAVEPAEPLQPVISEIPRPIPPARKIPSPEPPGEAEPLRTPEVFVPPSRRRVIVAHTEKEHAPHHPLHSLPAHGGLRPEKSRTADHHRPELSPRHSDQDSAPAKETERQRIERELRRQRSMAIGGASQKNASQAGKIPEKNLEKQVIQRKTHHIRADIEEEMPVKVSEPAEIEISAERRTVIVGKRKTVLQLQDERDTSSLQEETRIPHPDESEDDDRSVEIRDRIFRARDEIFTGKGVKKTILPPARDSTLLHTELKSKNKTADNEDSIQENNPPETEDRDIQSGKKRIRTDKS